MITLWSSSTAAGSRLVEGLAQSPMRPDEMIIGAPPFEIQVEFAGQLGETLGAAGERGETAAQGEIDPFDERRLNAARQAQ